MRRLRLAGFLVVVAGLWGGWLWLRDTSLFSVDAVRITGLSGTVAPVIRGSLDAAARRMTTTHVQLDRLRAAVAPFTIVKDLRVSTSFPHGLTIHVVEQQPVGALTTDSGGRVAVASDGTVVRGLAAPSQLPVLPGAGLPTGRRITDPQTRQAVAVMAAAPIELRDRVARVGQGPAGLTIYLRQGPALYFGDRTRPHAKWAAAAAVLADRGARGARYIDLRMPERPAAQVASAATTPGASTRASSTLAGASAASPGPSPGGG